MTTQLKIRKCSVRQKIYHAKEGLSMVTYLDDVNPYKHIDRLIAGQLQECANYRVHFHVLRQGVLPHFQRAL